MANQSSSSSDVRWIQRYQHFLQALAQLKEAFELEKIRPFTKLENQGLIQGFEFTHELAWNLLKDYLEFNGHQGLIGSRDTSREAFKRGLIFNGDSWMEMIKSRNQAPHTYNQKTSEEIVNKIKTLYFTEFLEMETRFHKIKETK